MLIVLVEHHYNHTDPRVRAIVKHLHAACELQKAWPLPEKKAADDEIEQEVLDHEGHDKPKEPPPRIIPMPVDPVEQHVLQKQRNPEESSDEEADAVQRPRAIPRRVRRVVFLVIFPHVHHDVDEGAPGAFDHGSIPNSVSCSACVIVTDALSVCASMARVVVKGP